MCRVILLGCLDDLSCFSEPFLEGNPLPPMLTNLFVLALIAVASVQAFVQHGVTRTRSSLSMIGGDQSDLPRSPLLLSKDGIIKSLSKVAVATALAYSTFVATGTFTSHTLFTHPFQTLTLSPRYNRCTCLKCCRQCHRCTWKWG